MKKVNSGNAFVSILLVIAVSGLVTVATYYGLKKYIEYREIQAQQKRLAPTYLYQTEDEFHTDLLETDDREDPHLPIDEFNNDANEKKASATYESPRKASGPALSFSKKGLSKNPKKYPQGIVGKRVKKVNNKIFESTSSSSSSSSQFTYPSDGNSIAFSITGITGGSDSSKDAYLTNGDKVTINWESSSGAATYDVTIYDSNGSTVKCPLKIITAPTVMYDFSDCPLSEGENYKVVVEAKTSGAITTVASNSPYSFKVDTTAPASFSAAGVTGGNDTIADTYLSDGNKMTLSWGSAEGAESYEIILYGSGSSTRSSTSTILYQATGITGTSHELDYTLEEGVSYSLQLAAKDSAGNTTIAGEGSISVGVDTTAPESFSISGITGGSETTSDAYLTNGDNPTVTWGSANGSTSYDVTIYESDGSTTKCATVNTTNTSYSFSSCDLSEGSTYKAKVAAKDDASNTTVASNSLYSFEVDTIAPGTFSVSGISGGSESILDDYLISGLNPTVSWGSSSGASSYSVTIYENDGSTVKCQAQSTTNTSLDFSSCALTNNTSYKAAITATDQAGHTTTASNSPYSFSVDTDTFTVTIGSSEPEITNVSPFSITITLSEAANDFAIGDLTVSNGAASNFTISSSTEYTADITPSSNGEVTIDVAAGTATSINGSKINAAATQASRTYYDCDYLLTTSTTDNFTGTASNEIFYAPEYTGGISYQTTDTLDGGAGTDSLIFYGDYSSVALIETNVSNMEEIDLNDYGTDYYIRIDDPSASSITVDGSGILLNSVTLDASLFTGDITINGGLGDDLLKGGRGTDTIMGSSGDDILVGGIDGDTLSGGNGDDSFYPDGQPFTASSISDMVLWLEPYSLDNIDLVNHQWKDQSGKNYHAVENTDYGHRPSYVYDGIYPAFDYKGASWDHFWTVDNLTSDINSDHSLAIIYKIDDDFAALSPVIFGSVDDCGDTKENFYMDRTAKTYHWNNASISIDSTDTYDLGDREFYLHIGTDSRIDGYVNGTDVLGDTSGSVQSGKTKFIIGHDWDDSGGCTFSDGGNELDGYIYEVLAYSDDLSSDERQVLEDYLAHKYCITLSGMSHGVDTMSGGSGSDTFYFTNNSCQTTGMGTRDIITDFVSGTDKIDLTYASKKMVFLGESDAQGSGFLSISYEKDGGNGITIVRVDDSGSGSTAFDIELTGVMDISESDFVLDDADQEGTGGGDTLTGTIYKDVIFGGAGDDTIYGKREGDYIKGEAGNDTLYGGHGGDYINGGDGDDAIYPEDASFTSTTVDDLEFWLDPRDPTTFDYDNNRVTDKSANSFHASRDTDYESHYLPFYTYDGVYPAYDYVGTDEFFISDSVATEVDNNDDYSLITVFKTTADVAAWDAFASFHDNAYDNEDAFGIDGGNDYGSWDNFQQPGQRLYTTNTRELFLFNGTTSQGDFYANGELFKTFGWGVQTDKTRFSIGQEWDGGANSSNEWDGYIFDVMVYGDDLTTAERQTVEDYLSNKYAINLEDAKLGVDVMTGGNGVDTYYITTNFYSGTGSGNRDIITDFISGTDKIDMSNVYKTYAYLGEMDASASNPKGQGFMRLAYEKDVANDITIIRVDDTGNGDTVYEIELTGAMDLAESDFVFKDPDTQGAGTDDSLDGTINVDVIFGGDGNDTISGMRAGDILLGEAGNDTLIGGQGGDYLSGGDGDDSIYPDGQKFTTSTIADMAMWLDAADLSMAKTDHWLDKSGNDNHGGIYTGHAFPTHTYDGDFAAYQLDQSGVKQFVVADTVTSSMNSDYSLATVYKASSFAGSPIIFSTHDSSANNQDMFLITTRYASYFNGTGFTANRGPTIDVLDSVVLTVDQTTPSNILRANGLEVENDDTKTSPANKAMFSIGQEWDGVGGDSNHLTGYIYEVIVYSDDLTTTERQTLEDYISNKYHQDLNGAIAGVDVLSGGTGTNTFYWTNNSWSGLCASDECDIITDFADGTNTIDFSGFETAIIIRGDSAAFFQNTDQAYELIWNDDGTDTTISIDKSGDGTANFQIKLENYVGLTSDKIVVPEVYYGADNPDAGNTITGGQSKDFIKGGSGADTLNGGAEDDTLVGKYGGDTLNGQDGNDTLFGDDQQLTASTFSNLKLWLESRNANNVILDEDDKVITWTDISGEGNDATQSTAANRPTYSSDASDESALSFDDTSAYLVDDNMAQYTDSGHSVFVVTQPSTQNDRSSLFTANTAGGVSNAEWIAINTDGTISHHDGNDDELSAADYRNLKFILTTSFSNTLGIDPYADGVYLGRASDNLEASVLWTIGAEWDGGPVIGNFFNGYIYEILFYSQDFNNNDIGRELIEQYLAYKYGITYNALAFGIDTLTGGDGDDYFAWTNASHSGVDNGNRDIITDFEQAGDADKIDFSGFTVVFHIRGTEEFTAGGHSEIRWAQDSADISTVPNVLNTIIQIDWGGDGTADFEICLQNYIVGDLASSDFVFTNAIEWPDDLVSKGLRYLFEAPYEDDGLAFPGIGCSLTTAPDLSFNYFTDGTLTNFDTCGTYGWQGTGITSDPYLLNFDGPDGDNDYVSIGANSILAATNEVTVEAWVKTPAIFPAAENYGGIFTYGQSSVTGYGLYMDRADLPASRNFKFSLLPDGQAWGDENSVAASVAEADRWYHAVGIRDIDAGTSYIDIYLNAAIENTDTGTGVTDIDYGALATAEMGGSLGDATSYWKGSIARVAVYDRALTPCEVTKNFINSGDRFRDTAAGGGIVTENIILYLDAANYYQGMSFEGTGCANTTWYPVRVPDALNVGTLTNFDTCGTYGWQGDGTVVTPYVLTFDGDDDVVEFGNLTDVLIVQEFTVEAWVKTPSAWPVIVEYPVIISSGTTSSDGMAFYLSTPHDPGDRTFRLSTLPTGFAWGSEQGVSTTKAVLDTWYHIVGVREVSGTISYNRIYINGVLEHSGSVDYNPAAPPDVDYGALPIVNVGFSRAADAACAGDGGRTCYWDSDIAIIRVYDDVLTLEEVKQNCNAQEDRFTAGDDICAN